MTARNLILVPLDDLSGDPRNPKAHDLAVIGDSVGRFGYVEPIVRDDRTGFIVSGHGRTAALRRAFDESPSSPPDGVEVGLDGRWLVPVLSGWASKNDDEAAAALIALNRTTETGGWDDVQLMDLLDQLADAEAGLVGVGYDDSDLANLHRLLDDAPDLDRLAGEWDGSGMKPKGPDPTTVVLEDPQVGDRWVDWRLSFSSDDEAMTALLNSVGGV
jgi:ParB-like chromosome segregation protein Spo0J